MYKLIRLNFSNLRSLGLCLAVSFAGVACAEKDVCQERTSDGPWSEVGVKAPATSEVYDIFSKKGSIGLKEKFGERLDIGSNEDIWIFESRQVSRRKQCDPSSDLLTYSQSFVLVRVVHLLEKHECTIETKDFIGPRMLSPSEVLNKKSGPLGVPLASCGFYSGSKAKH